MPAPGSPADGISAQSFPLTQSTVYCYTLSEAELQGPDGLDSFFFFDTVPKTAAAVSPLVYFFCKRLYQTFRPFK